MTPKQQSTEEFIREMFEALADEIRKEYGASENAYIIIDDDGNVLGTEEPDQ